jgi:hypothetical protein
MLANTALVARILAPCWPDRAGKTEGFAPSKVNETLSGLSGTQAVKSADRIN